MPDITNRFGIEVLVADGAMGTMLHRAEIPAEQCPEQLNTIAPDVVLDVHRNYVLAGADCITTNTFGGSRPKLDAYGLGDDVAEFNRAAVKLARQAGAVHVLGDVGPSGLVMEPLGETTFDELFGHFAEQIEALASQGPDAILVETMTDIAEARCALLAARHVCDLPVFVTVTFGLSGRLELSGTSPEAAAVILEACGAAAVGANCGLGPKQMLPLVHEMAEATALPLVVQPNAGMPRVENGETVFPGTPDELGEYAVHFVDAGATIVGSCCGSTPQFTGSIADFAKPRKPAPKRLRPDGLALASAREAVRIGGGRSLAIIGERINPTGKPRLAESLRDGSVSVVREYAVEQQHAGADLLDVNVGAPEVDEVAMLPAAVLALAGLSDLPIVVDNTNPDAVEAALKAYPGRALLNSVSGSADALEQLLPVAARYGAAVLILALDDDGIPSDSAGRLAVAQRVRSAAHAAGLRDIDLAVDGLVMTAATDADAASVTLAAVRAVTNDWGLPTVLGISNISHGLPGRPVLNSAFLAMAADAGLSAAIAGAGDLDAEAVRAATDLLEGRDPGAERWIAWVRANDARHAAEGAPSAGQALGDEAPPGSRAALVAAVEAGDAEATPSLVDALVREGFDPGDVIAGILTPAIQRLGDGFGRGEVFLPQLMVAAEAMKAAVERAKRHLPDADSVARGTVAFGTVKGDIHSIGKDICVSLLESAGYAVNDLGVDVTPEEFARAADAADAVCVSALMTTTLPSMEVTARLASEAGAPVIVGGAVVTSSFAESIGAGYAQDAPGCVSAVQTAIDKAGSP